MLLFNLFLVFSTECDKYIFSHLVLDIKHYNCKRCYRKNLGLFNKLSRLCPSYAFSYVSV